MLCIIVLDYIWLRFFFQINVIIYFRLCFCTKTTRLVSDGSKFIKDLPGISLEAGLESFPADPICAPPGSGSDVEVQSTFYKAETAVASLTTTRGSRSDARLSENAPVIVKPLEFDYQLEDLLSPVPWVSHGDVVIENSIEEGLDRVRELVGELFPVDNSCNEIEANTQFVQGLLKKLCDEMADNWGNEGLGFSRNNFKQLPAKINEIVLKKPG